MTDNSNSNPKSNPNNSPDLFFNKVDINVEKLYNDTLQKIDQIRSYVVVSSVLINKNINLNKQDFDEILKKNIKKERTPQESRCHAYYRLLGLPAVDKDGYGYNPGFDKDNNSNSNFLKRKLSTFNNIDPKLINLMSKREDYNSNYFTKFFNSQDIKASALALSSLDKRTFSSTFLNDEPNPFDPNINNQKHFLSDFEIQRRANSIQDINGNTSDFPSDENTNLNEIDAIVKNPTFYRYHLLKPFMVDPRIDLTVSPTQSLICVPFVNDNTKQIIFNDVKLSIPIIEQVCRERLNIGFQDKKIGDYSQKIIDFVKTEDLFKNNEFLQKAFSSKVTNVDQEQIAGFLNILFGLLLIVKVNISQVKSILETWNYVPLPNKNGLESGCSTVKLVPKDPNNTDRDKDLINHFIMKLLRDLNNSFINEKSYHVVDNSDFLVKDIVPSPLKGNTDSVDNTPNKSFSDLKTQRDHECQDANTFLKQIEMIMGEFSGLGLIDYHVIRIALYTISKETLINLLDDLSFSRLILNEELLCEEVKARKNNKNNPSFNMQKALSNLESEIRLIFSLLDYYYEKITL